VNKGVGCAQVYPDVSREKAEQSVQAEHDWRLFLLLGAGFPRRSGEGRQPKRPE
jgi:hypothetical protein